MLILRMMRFEGPFYHSKFGPDEVVLKDQLVVSSASEPAPKPVSDDRVEADTPDRVEMIRLLAYKLWEHRGQPFWDDQRDWHAAEAMIASGGCGVW